MIAEEQAEEHVVANNDVGISLMAGEEADAIVDILREELGDRLRVNDHLTYVKLETDAGRLEVFFDEVGQALGRPFTLGDFQVIFASYYGRPQVFDHKMGVYSSMTAGVIRDGDTEEDEAPAPENGEAGTAA